VPETVGVGVREGVEVGVEVSVGVKLRSGRSSIVGVFVNVLREARSCKLRWQYKKGLEFGWV